ncbi:hypothetical protein [Larkinella soli]|uniref:hypothetical protein n=1 Tax=Larkinella soli TaxID=1770527 RepID=UPI000FFBAE95|nr:hypothetical protein [Larkinella soli]
MVRKLLLYSWLFAVLLPTFSQWGTIAYYQVNKDYIARVLCQNRDKPQLHCDGKCYLAKQLRAQQDRQDQETAERVQNLPVVQLFCQHPTPFRFHPVPIVLSETIRPHAFLPAYSVPLSALFRPPRV